MIKEVGQFSVLGGIILENGEKIFLYDDGYAEGFDGQKYQCKYIEHKGVNPVKDWIEIIGWEMI